MKSSERKTSFLFELEDLARRSKNPKILQSMAKDHFNNPVICMHIAANAYVEEETLVLLSTHPDYEVRTRVATYSFKISSKNTLSKLALDKNHNVKAALARRTTSQSILELLINTNRKNDEIIETCLSRTTELSIIKKFISRNSKEIVSKYVDAIYSNNNFSLETLYSIL